MEFRAAVLADLPRIRQMYRRIVADMDQKGIGIWNEYYPFAYFEEDIQKGELFLLLEGEQLCGAFVLTGQADGQSAVEWADPAAKALYLDRLGIDPGCSGQGIGGQALVFAMDLAREKGAAWLRLFVVDRNRPARRLYRKTGFSQVPGVFEEDGGGCILHEYGYEIRL